MEIRLIVFISLYIFGVTANGCDCEAQDIKHYVKNSRYVYYGLVTKVELKDYQITPASPYKSEVGGDTEINITVDPLVEYKGDSGKRTTLTSVISDATCGVNPRVGEKLFFFANADGSISLCSGMLLNGRWPLVDMHLRLRKALQHSRK